MAIIWAWIRAHWLTLLIIGALLGVGTYFLFLNEGNEISEETKTEETETQDTLAFTKDTTGNFQVGYKKGTSVNIIIQNAGGDITGTTISNRETHGVVGNGTLPEKVEMKSSEFNLRSFYKDPEKYLDKNAKKDGSAAIKVYNFYGGETIGDDRILY